MQRGLLPGADPRGMLGCAQRRLTGVLGISDRERPVLVIGDLGEQRARIALVLPLEVLRRAQVEPRAHTRRERRERGLPEQRVREAEARRAARVRARSPRLAPTRRRGRAHRSAGGPPPRRRPSASKSRPSTAPAETSDVAAGESRSSGRRIRSRARAGSTTPSRGTRSGSASAPRSSSRRSASRANKRHSLRARVELRGEVGRCGSPEHLLEQHRDLGAREGLERDLDAAVLRTQPRESARHRITRLARLIAHRCEQEQRRVERLVREMLEQVQRCGARPLQVFEHHQERSAPRRPLQRAAHGVEQQEAALLRRARVRAGRLRAGPAAR